MAGATLVDQLLKDATALIRELDRRGLGPSLAVWLRSDEDDDWRLAIAGRHFDGLLPERLPDAYLQLAESMSAIAPTTLRLSDLRPIRTTEPLVRAVATLLRTRDRDLLRAHDENTTIDGIFVPEMVIVRSAA